MSAKTIYPVGAVVWWARCGVREVTRPCPVCFGKLTVTLILGNGEHVGTPCDYCGKGYMGPQGTETEHEWIASAEQATIHGVRTEQSGDKVSANYTTAAGFCFDDTEAFETKEEAEAKCAEKIEEHARENNRAATHRKEYNHKNYAWHVGYHRREAKRARDSLAWHEARAIVCKDLSRTAEPKQPEPTAF